MSFCFARTPRFLQKQPKTGPFFLSNIGTTTLLVPHVNGDLLEAVIEYMHQLGRPTAPTPRAQIFRRHRIVSLGHPTCPSRLTLRFMEERETFRRQRLQPRAAPTARIPGRLAAGSCRESACRPRPFPLARKAILLLQAGNRWAFRALFLHIDAPLHLPLVPGHVGLVVDRRAVVLAERFHPGTNSGIKPVGMLTAALKIVDHQRLGEAAEVG